VEEATRRIYNKRESERKRRIEMRREVKRKKEDEDEAEVEVVIMGRREEKGENTYRIQ
jgi:hypothetical protein